MGIVGQRGQNQDGLQIPLLVHQQLSRLEGRGPDLRGEAPGGLGDGHVIVGGKARRAATIVEQRQIDAVVERIGLIGRRQMGPGLSGERQSRRIILGRIGLFGQDDPHQPLRLGVLRPGGQHRLERPAGAVEVFGLALELGEHHGRQPVGGIAGRRSLRPGHEVRAVVAERTRGSQVQPDDIAGAARQAGDGHLGPGQRLL